MNTNLPSDNMHETGTALAKENPNPRKAYQIVMTLVDAPGTFESIRGVAQYDVANYLECGRIDEVNRNISRITENIPFVLEKVSQTQYSGVIYADLLLDEDYYGRGVCHWKLTAVRTRLKATGAQEETRFVSRLGSDSILAGMGATSYYWKGGYPRSRADDYVDIGFPDEDKYKPELRDQLFSITLEAKDVQP